MRGQTLLAKILRVDYSGLRFTPRTRFLTVGRGKDNTTRALHTRVSKLGQLRIVQDSRASRGPATGLRQQLERSGLRSRRFPMYDLVNRKTNSKAYPEPFEVISTPSVVATMQTSPFLISTSTRAKELKTTASGKRSHGNSDSFVLACPIFA